MRELHEMMDESESLENEVHDDSEAYNMSDDEVASLLKDDTPIKAPKRSIFDVPSCRFCSGELNAAGGCDFCDNAEELDADEDYGVDELEFGR